MAQAHRGVDRDADTGVAGTGGRSGIQVGGHAFNKLWHAGRAVVPERKLPCIVGAKAQNAAAAAAHLLLERAPAR